MRYGVANRCGRPDKEEISRVLYAAAELGVSMLDTAPGYGDVEKMLGSFGEAMDGFGIITKTPRLEGSNAMGDGRHGIAAALDRSLRDLGRDKVYGLLIHHPDDATGPGSGELLAALSHLKADGLVENIGISVYGPADIDGFAYLDDIDIVQLPLNVLDQRFMATGQLSKLKEQGIEIHARSAFLQGLLLMPPEDIPDHLAASRPVLKRYREGLAEAGVSPVQGALGYLNGIAGIDSLVVGAQTEKQIREIMSAADSPPSLDYRPYACDDPAVVDPRLWPRLH